jgi:hypothetical protein
MIIDKRPDQLKMDFHLHEGGYPAIEQRARAEGGEIHWGDETALVSTDVRGRSYAPTALDDCHGYQPRQDPVDDH